MKGLDDDNVAGTWFIWACQYRVLNHTSLDAHKLLVHIGPLLRMFAFRISHNITAPNRHLRCQVVADAVNRDRSSTVKASYWQLTVNTLSFASAPVQTTEIAAFAGPGSTLMNWQSSKGLEVLYLLALSSSTMLPSNWSLQWDRRNCFKTIKQIHWHRAKIYRVVQKSKPLQKYQ